MSEIKTFFNKNDFFYIKDKIHTNVFTFLSRHFLFKKVKSKKELFVLGHV